MSQLPSDWWVPSRPDSLEVEPESLAHFADLLEGDRAHFTISRADGVDELFREYPRFAGGEDGLVEGQNFQNAYVNVAYAMNCLLADVHNGLLCLEQAAKAIASEYGEADAFSAATVGAVQQAFDDVVQPLGPVGVPAVAEEPPPAPAEPELADGDDVRSDDDIVIREGQPGEVVYRQDNDYVQEREV